MEEGGVAERWGTWRVGWATASNLKQLEQMLASGEIEGVGFSPHRGFPAEKLDQYLKSLQAAKGFVLVYADKFDIRPVYSCRSVRFLTVSDNKQEIDLEVFPFLEDLNIEWHSKVRLPREGFRQLESLRIRRFQSPNRDLVQLAAFQNLRYLEVVDSAIGSLRGLEELRHLKELQLHYLRRLSLLDSIDGLGLAKLIIGNCRRIQNHEFISRIQSLEELALNNCGEMETLEFLKALPELRDFRFVGTNVKDGDLTPVLGLRNVQFTNKRHFSHSYKEIQKRLGNEPIA